MSKRFIDSKIWSDTWFQELDQHAKLFWIYLFTNCDIIGLWEFNPKRAEFDLGKKINWEEMQKNISSKVIFTEKYWIIKTFISQQYPNLNKKPNAPLHISVLNEIEKKCLNFDLNSLSIDYRYPIDSVQVEVEVKEKVKVEEKEEEKEELWKQKTDAGFEAYLDFAEPEFDKLKNDWQWIADKKRFYPGVNISLSLDKMWEEFWGTRAGWENIRKRKSKEVDWKRTIENGLSMKMNQVRFGYNEPDYELTQLKARGVQ
jgi:hypothetical protein